MLLTVVILQTLYAGENLNDLQWHTVYIQRRGNEMEVWVDDEEHTRGKTLSPIMSAVYIMTLSSVGGLHFSFPKHNVSQIPLKAWVCFNNF